MGLVLAGGKSSRMGCDKAMLHPFGSMRPSMLERAFQLLATLTSSCMVSCARGHPYRGYPCLEDKRGPEGPCRGLLAGLEYALSNGMQSVLALACDMPTMRREVLAELLNAHTSAPQGTLASFYKSGATGKIEMLAGAYSVKLLPALHAGLQRGEKSLYWLVPASHRQLLLYDESRADCFLNCNTPQDLRKLTERGKDKNSLRLPII